MVGTILDYLRRSLLVYCFEESVKYLKDYVLSKESETRYQWFVCVVISFFDASFVRLYNLKKLHYESPWTTMSRINTCLLFPHMDGRPLFRFSSHS